MSPSAPLSDRPAGAVATSIGRRLVSLTAAVAFWIAVAFPAVYAGGYLAVVFVPGFTAPGTPILAGLLAVNVLALVLGHRHDAGSGNPRRRTDSREPSRADSAPTAVERTPGGD